MTHRPWALALSLLLAGCAAVPGDPFAVRDLQPNIPAPEGQDTATVTMKGRVNSHLLSRYSRLTVAAVNETETLSHARVVDGRFELALPAKPELNRDEGLAYIERWWFVMFDDLNGDGVFNYNLPHSQAHERDTEIPISQRYRFGYRTYAISHYAFLPLNNLQQGWVLSLRTAMSQTAYSQDFSRTYTVTDARSIGN